MTASELGLPRGASIFLDSSPLIYLVEGSGPRKACVEALFELAGADGWRFFASTLAWTELLGGPLGSGDEKLALSYRRLLADSRRIELVPPDVAIAEEAARLRALRRLELADAIHLATALALHVDAVLGNDEKWRSVPECPRLFLVDELAFDFPPAGCSA